MYKYVNSIMYTQQTPRQQYGVYTCLNFNRKWFGSEYFLLHITLTQAHL